MYSIFLVTCELPKLVGNLVCNQQNNHEGCDFDGGDCYEHECDAYSLYLMGDGYCAQDNNYESCNFDGGDCVYVNAGAYINNYFQ